jgi:type IV pilus assembly protein PilW
MIRAQYGLASTTTDSAVSSWRSATEDAPLTSTDRQRLRMIRLGVLAVNTQRERPATTGSCDTTLSAPTLWPGETVDLSGRSDWQCYRYRSFSTVVSLRNMLLGQSL